MRIHLEEPFKSLWKKGYIRLSKIDGRRRVDLVNCDRDRTTISYARYLMSVKIGRFLNDDEEVDHVDKDCSNDSLDNLKILSKEHHRQKTANERKGRLCKLCTCPVCGKEFIREVRQIKKGAIPKCSRSCNGKQSRKIQLGQLV